MEQKKILIIDDHATILDALKMYVEKVFPETEVIALLGFKHTMHFLQESRVSNLALAIIDGQLENGSMGSDLYPHIRRMYPDCKIMSHSSSATLNQCAIEKHGADCAYHKGDDLKQFVEVIASALNCLAA